MVGEIVDQDEEPIIRRRDYQRQQQPDQQQEPQQESQEPDQQEQHDQRIYKVSPINCAKVFTLLFAFRAYNAILVSTWFDPDETWQSLEVAHNLVFGYGALTWEWKHGIRSALHPLLFAGIYKSLKYFGLDHSFLFIYAPKLLQAAFAAITDGFAFLLAFRMFGLETARWTLSCMIMSWFNSYCLIRTYSNSLEASLTIVALYFWPIPRNPPPTRGEFRISLAIAALCCIIRVTNSLIWIFLGIQMLRTYPHRRTAIFFDVIVTGLAAVSTSFMVDSYFYGRLLFTPWEFFKANILDNISQFYGSHPFHWYFTQGLPLVMLTFLPFSIHGAYLTRQYPQKLELFWMCCFMVLVLSATAHKEFRFLMPLVAPLLIYCGQSLHMIQKSDIRFNRKGMKAYLTRSLLLLFCTNVLVGIYFNRCHKRGVIQIMKWLRQEAYQGTVTDILFLMPCHSAPFYSYIHLDIPMRYITCEPPLGVQNKTAYRDETDILYQNPESFFRTYFSNQMGSRKLPFSEKGIDPIPVENQTYTIQPYKWPSHLVWYDNPTLAPYLRPLMNGSDYKECARFFNSHFHDDTKQNGQLVISCMNQPKITL